MWREYTRETPGRTGWSLLTTSLALAGTTGLAYYVTTTKAAPAAVLPARFVAPGWPISVALPRGFRDAMLDIGEPLVARDGASGDAHFMREHERGGAGIISLHFRVQDAGADLHRAFAKWTRLEPDEGEAIKIGPLDGLAAVLPQPDGPVRRTAVAVLPEGLIIVIEQDTSSDSARNRRQFEAVCESVEFKDWFVPVVGEDRWIEGLERQSN